MLLVCYSLLNSQNISVKNSVKKSWLLVLGQLKKLEKLHRKMNNNWPMVNFYPQWKLEDNLDEV